ncbi:hypothetical protein AB1Y20_016498 [Prymnesium parvum]|uniref:Guanine nucleotide-binding protein subunit beta-like protein n=1 Tax=Prymnesium parvum TaxID=97485 RepID=A0AB34I9P4_PRYPA
MSSSRGRGGFGGRGAFGGNSTFGSPNGASGKATSKGARGGKGGRYDNNWGGSRGRGGKGGKGKAAESSLPKSQAVLVGHTDTVTGLAVDEARKQFFSGSLDATVKVWSWEAGFQCVHTVSAGAPVECILSLDSWLFAGTAATTGAGGVVNGVVRVWHMDNGFEQTLEGHQDIFTLAQGGVYLFSGGDDMGVKTWQYANDKFEPLINLTGHTAPIQDMKVVGNALISADRTGNVIFWDLATGQQTNALQTGHTNNLLALWVEDTCLFTSALDGVVKVWDAAGTLLFEQSVTNQSHQPSGITAMLVTSDAAENSVLVTACSDKALKMWLMPTFDKRGILNTRVGHSDCVRCLAKGPGNSFFSGSMDHTIIVWEFM